MNNQILDIVKQLQDIQSGKNWIGSSYSSKLNEIDEKDIFIRPLPNMLSIGEIISHLTLWREETILKIVSGEGSKTDDCPENFLSNDQLEPIGWSRILSRYNESLQVIVTLLMEKEDSFLDELYYDTDFKGNYTYRWLLHGMIQHDAYHLGQIGIVIKNLNQ